jgi:hypothetical protein
MTALSKPGALDLAQVHIAPDAYAYLHQFLASLHRRILERAAIQAQQRDPEADPARICIDDVVCSGQALLPLVAAELEPPPKQENSDVRHAS